MRTKSEKYKLQLFNKLFLEEHEELYAAFREHATYKEFKSEEFLFNKEQASQGVHLILNGVARLHSKTSENDSLIVRFLKEGDMAGIIEVFNGVGHQYSAMVHSRKLELCTLTKEAFLDMLRDFPAFGMQVIKQVDKDASFIEMRMADIRSQRVSDRIEGMMSAIKDKFGLDEQGHINLDITPSNIAQMIGATRTTVYRSLKQLEEKGIMQLENHRIRPLRVKAF